MKKIPLLPRTARNMWDHLLANVKSNVNVKVRHNVETNVTDNIETIIRQWNNAKNTLRSVSKQKRSIQ